MRPPPEPPPTRLLALLQHADHEIACIAANALASSGDARLVPLLADYLQSPPPDKKASGRKYAAHALLRLGDVGWEIAARLIPESLTALCVSDDSRAVDILADHLARMPTGEPTDTYYYAARGLARTDTGRDRLITLFSDAITSLAVKHQAVNALVECVFCNRSEMLSSSLAAPLLPYLEEQLSLEWGHEKHYPWSINNVVQMLGNVEGDAVQSWLLDAFLHGNDHSLVYCGSIIAGLAKHKMVAAVERLCQLLHDDNDPWFVEERLTDGGVLFSADKVRHGLRRSAAYALGEIGDHRAIPSLRARYDASREQTLLADNLDDSDPVQLCVVCANALARLNDETALARLMPFIAAPIDEYHYGVSPVAGFVTLGDAAVDFLIEAVGSADEIEVMNAASALAQIDSERTVPVLRRLLEHPDAYIRGLAVGGLRKAGDRASAAHIAAMLEPKGNATDWNLYLPIFHALKEFADPTNAPAVAAAIPNRRGILLDGLAVETLRAFGSAAFPPVRALLAADAPRTRADAVLTLAYLGDGDALPLLRVGGDEETDPLARDAFEVAVAYLEVRAEMGVGYVPFC